MPAAKVPEVTIELDRERTLRLDFKGLLIVEELTGRDFTTEAAWDNLGLKGTTALVYGCLKHEDPELTFDRVAELLHPGNAQYVSERVKALIREAFGEDVPGEGDARPFPEASGGSGPSGASTSG